jgi:hypothetical protein
MRATPLAIAAPLLLLSSVAEPQGLGRQHEQYGLSGSAKAKACRTEGIGATRRAAGTSSTAQNLAALEAQFKAAYDQCMRKR